MRIGIDGGCWNNRRGYGRFLRELLEAVARIDQRNQYTVFLDSAGYRDFHLTGPFRAEEVFTSQSVSEAASSESRRSVFDLLRMSRAVAAHELDLFFFPSVYSYFPLLRRVPTILGIHDTIADRNPQFAFGSWRQELFWRGKVCLAIDQSNMILTVSEYSKRCVREVFHVPSSSVRVLYEAASPIFRKLDLEAPTERYALYVGGISPNKNLQTLIRAFAKLRARQSGVKLMLVGDYQSDGFKGCYRDLKSLTAALGVDAEVVFTGYVPDDELCRLYNQASLFVMPSFDEGFGLPALEAMACGAPVVVSSGNSLEEVVADAGLHVDPRDEAGLTAAMERLLENPVLSEQFAQRALTRAAEFSWDAAARRMLEIFRDAV